MLGLDLDRHRHDVRLPFGGELAADFQALAERRVITQGLLDPDQFFARAQARFIAGERQLIDPAPELLLFGPVNDQVGRGTSMPGFSIGLIKWIIAVFSHLYRIDGGT